MKTVLILFTAMPCLSRQQYFNQPQNTVNFPSYNFPPFGAQFQPPSSNPQPNYYHSEMGQFQPPSSNPQPNYYHSEMGQFQPPNGFQQPQPPIDGYQQSQLGFQQAQNVYQQPNHYHEYQGQYQPPSDYHQHYDYSDNEMSQSRRRGGEYTESCECECMRCEDPKPCCEQICYECQPKPVPENPSNLVFVPYPYPILLPAQRQPPMATTPTTTSTTTPTTTSTTTPTTTTTTTTTEASTAINRVKLAKRYSDEMMTTTSTTPTTTTTPATTTTTTRAPRTIPNNTESLLADADYPWANWEDDISDEKLASTCEPEVTENFFEMLRKNQKENKVRSSKLRSMGMRPIKTNWSSRYGIVPISEDLLVSLIAGSREVKHFNSL